MKTDIQDALRDATTITFDCYGTLIDWDAGLRSAFGGIFGEDVLVRLPMFFDDYNRIEAEVENESFRPYREVLGETVKRVAQHYDLHVSSEKVQFLAESLPGWRPFSDTNESLRRLKAKYRLGILSNIERDLFAGTADHFEVDFDFLITAEDVRSYKPGKAHFERLLEQEGERSSVVHVAQSLFHDGQPTGEMGIAYVWINRYNHANEMTVQPLAEFSNLRSFADVVSNL